MLRVARQRRFNPLLNLPIRAAREMSDTTAANGFLTRGCRASSVPIRPLRICPELRAARGASTFDPTCSRQLPKCRVLDAARALSVSPVFPVFDGTKWFMQTLACPSYGAWLGWRALSRDREVFIHLRCRARSRGGVCHLIRYYLLGPTTSMDGLREGGFSLIRLTVNEAKKLEDP